MARVHRWIALPLLAAAAAAPVAPAAAEDAGEAVVETRDRASGSIVVTWRGDEARGCAAAGLCDVRGSMTLATRDSGGVQSGSIGARPVEFESFTVPIQPAVARVVRGPVNDPGGSCADTTGDVLLDIEAEAQPGGSVRLTSFPLAPGGQGSAVAGRCAGPLLDDILPALPTAELAASTLRRRSFEVDLAGRRAFAAGPFSGEVASTLRIRRRSRVVSAERSRFPSPIPEEQGRRAALRRRALLLLEYDVAATGGVDATFAGGEEPFCLPLDACGLSGAVTARDVRLAGGAPVRIIAEGPASALRGRRGVGAALRAFRAGRLRVDGAAFAQLRGRIAATAAREGGPECREERRGELPLLAIRARRGGGGVRVALGAQEGGGSGFGASRCPGARVRDLPGGVIAAATIPRARLGARRLDVRLAGRGTATGPYAIDVRSDLAFRLRRARARLYMTRRPV
jgi:hypothetical protein